MSLTLARALVFGSSAVVLVLEILAGRLMAPYVGVTLETFTGIIGVVLAGIALGAWGGGRAADRRAPMTLLGPLLLVGAAFVLAAPVLTDAVGPRMRSAGPVEIVVLSAVAFFVPSVLLSAVTPIVVKARLSSLDETGTVVGSFSAVGTFGALAGTFLTGFVLVASVSTRTLILVLGLLVAGAGLVIMLKAGGRTGEAAALAALVALAASATAFSHRPCGVETRYFCAVIELDGDRPTGRTLWLDTLRHSYVDLADPTHLEFRYSKIVEDVIAELPDGPIDAAYIGGGGFTLPRYVQAVRPGSTADVMEIDPELVEIARRDLGLELGGGIQVDVGDARLAMPRRTDDRFDLVLGDAFGGLSVPWHLTTREFLIDIKRVMAPEAVYVINLLDYPPLGFARAEAATFLDVFDDVAVIAPPSYLSAERGGNFVLVGALRPFEWAEVQDRIIARGGEEQVLSGVAVRGFVAGARSLTDDFAPVDQIISRPS